MLGFYSTQVNKELTIEDNKAFCSRQLSDEVKDKVVVNGIPHYLIVQHNLAVSTELSNTQKNLSEFVCEFQRLAKDRNIDFEKCCLIKYSCQLNCFHLADTCLSNQDQVLLRFV